MPFREGTFKNIILGEILEHMYRPEEVLMNIYNTLKPKGKLILSVPTKYGLYGIIYDWIWTTLRAGYNADGHVQRFTSKKLIEHIQNSGFKLEHFMNFCFLGFFLKKKKFVDIDFNIAMNLPREIANNWIVVGRKR